MDTRVQVRDKSHTSVVFSGQIQSYSKIFVVTFLNKVLLYIISKYY